MAIQTVANLEQLRQLPEAARLRQLLERGEDQWFDRVSSRIEARELADSMIAFANAEGGLIAIGISEGHIEGTKDAGKKLNEWRQAARDFSDPPVRHRLEAMPCLNARGEPDSLLLIEIASSASVHVNRKGEGFLRVGDENRKLNPLELQELGYEKGQSFFDGTVVAESSLKDFDAALVATYRRRIGARRPGPEILVSRGLAATYRGETKPTMAGILVLGSSPQRFFPEAFVRVLRYQGTTREVGPRSNILRDAKIEGALPRQLDQAQRHLSRLLPRPIRLKPTGRFGRMVLIPDFAWREAVVNAVLHRSYSLGGDHIRVAVYDDRIEVESPGRFPGLVRPDNIRTTRFARNPRIARAMADLGYGAELGEGVNRMYEEMERVGLPEPLFREGAGGVRLVLLTESVFARMLRRLGPGSEPFVEHVSRTGRVTTREAIALLGVSKPTVLKRLHDLSSAGLLEHAGTSLKDPTGYWRLKGA